MVDPPRLESLLARIKDEVRELEDLASMGRSALLTDRRSLAAAKYGLIVAIEAAIDAGEHIIASQGLKTPATFGEVFRVLGDHGFLPKEEVDALRAMAGFRNVLVHGYANVDDGKVVDVLEGHLDDLMRFRREIARSALGS